MFPTPVKEIVGRATLVNWINVNFIGLYISLLEIYLVLCYLGKKHQYTQKLQFQPQ